MLKNVLFCLVLLHIGIDSYAQAKINDAIGGVILTSYSVHRMNSPFIHRRTIMYFINIEDKYVLRFDGLQATMDGKLLSISLVDSVWQLSYCGFNRKIDRGFTESITYNMRENRYLLQRENKRIIHKKIECEFREGQAWYMIPDPFFPL